MNLLKELEEKIDIYNVTTTLENFAGFQDYIFRRISYRNRVTFSMEPSFGNRISISCYENEKIMFSVSCRDSYAIKYIREKYLSRSNAAFSTTFEIDKKELEEFFDKDLEFLTDSYFNYSDS